MPVSFLSTLYFQYYLLKCFPKRWNSKCASRLSRDNADNQSTLAPPIQFLTLALYKFIYLLTYLLTPDENESWKSSSTFRAIGRGNQRRRAVNRGRRWASSSLYARFPNGGHSSSISFYLPSPFFPVSLHPVLMPFPFSIEPLAPRLNPVRVWECCKFPKNSEIARPPNTICYIVT